ncbi:CcdC protein domain-containing protein [Sphingomonas abietis]|uniref:DUF1453 family protein n=1 Tax=Sphingomonas abietis TaxID=3012344 RepID=A0ABY7NQE9_9SPHN|nr:CcdC protein domain-containing protein [Sphingomonas abietis]WBO22777.1 DUF1453 family protein [Sphingomonas abietis]
MQYVVPAVIILLVVGIRLWRMRGARRLRLETLWILPALYAVFVIGMFATHPPTPIGFAAAAAALVIGGGIGWYRGTMMRISVDPETHALSQQASPLAVLLLVGLLLVRRVAMEEMGGTGLNAQIAIDVLMAFALGLIATTRIEMLLRARRLLREARASGLSQTFR